MKNLTIDQLASCRISQKFMKDSYMTECICTWQIFFQQGFRKGYNAQHYPSVTIEKMKNARDKNKVYAAALTYLSKAFDCLKHDLLIAKLHAVLISNLLVINAYLSNRVQVIKVGSLYSEILDVIFGVRKGSTEGSSNKKFIGVAVDSNLTFEKHLNELCRQGKQKLHAYTRCVIHAYTWALKKDTHNSKLL